MGEGLDFEVDKIVNSIEEIATGVTYKTEVILVSADEIKRIHKKDGWQFDWKREFKRPDSQLYKLIYEQYIEMRLIESAPHNRKPNKKFEGVGPNLVAFICKMSFELGFSGTVAFLAKTKMVDHYKMSLGAESIFSRERMAINEAAAKELVNSYYKDFFNGG